MHNEREYDKHWKPVEDHYARFCGSQRWYGYDAAPRPRYLLAAAALVVIGVLAAMVGA